MTAPRATRSRRPYPIALVMIVRDEERCLDRCLASVTDLVDEIVVVDTGSTDRTVEIAQTHGAKVAKFAWVDDFAAARNFSLAQTTAPWRLTLDADQWLLDRETARTALDRLGRTRPTFFGMVELFEADKDGSIDERVAPLPHPRLLPSHARYAGRVHEQPIPELPLQAVAIAVGHDGYTAEALARKEGRNLGLLVASLEGDPTNAYLWYQLGSEHAARGRHQEALPALIQAFNLTHPADESVPAPPESMWWHRLTLRLILALIAVGQYEEASALGDMEADRWAGSAEIAYAHGRAQRALALVLDESQNDRAERLIAASMSRWRQAVDLGATTRYAGSFAEPADVLAARLLAEDYEVMGRREEAARYRALASR